MMFFSRFKPVVSISTLILNNTFTSIIAITLIFSSSLLACTVISNVESDIPPADVLFQDDFSDPSSGWDQVRNDEGVTDYEDGIYRISVHRANSDYWTHPNLNFSDVRIFVEATKVGGSDDNYFGVLCRYQDVENFYFFIISSDGYYGIGKLKDNIQTLISSDNLLPSEEIHQGETTNYIQASCIGNVLTLYVNDQLLINNEDNDLISGDVGLIAGTNDINGTDIQFDNFRVFKP
jgi:hypothetical protein